MVRSKKRREAAESGFCCSVPSRLASHVLLVWIFRPDLRGTAGGGALTTSPKAQG